MILHLILGDQLDRASALFDRIDRERDRLWMAEVQEESTHVWSHKARTAYFLSAMRHFRDELKAAGYLVEHRTLEDNRLHPGFREALGRDLHRLQPSELRMVEPGDFRVSELIRTTAADHGVPLTILPDRHFACDADRFRRHAAGRKTLRMEYFYREMRREHRILLRENGSPEGGEWNFDAANRKPFPSSGPGPLPPGSRFPPDAVTRAVFADVERHFPGHPGSLDAFDWPVTPAQAEKALQDFIEHRLPNFGAFQDAMWTGEPYLYHARLSCALNVKLIHPLRVCRAVEEAWRSHPDRIPLAAAEGFIRQVLGWREYVHGIYHLFMPGYRDRNELGATLPLPDFYWTGRTEMACLRAVIQQTLATGYAHHIQRLMVTGLFALLLGVHPRAVHEWYLAVYVDAVEWVELPNTLGMSQYADGGVMASKPYAASGAYIDRMSNYCKGCRFKPAVRGGADACPFTVLYWDFLERHRDRLAANPRTTMQIRNLDRLDPTERRQLRQTAESLRARLYST